MITEGDALTPEESAVLTLLEATPGREVGLGKLAYAMTRAGRFNGLEDLAEAVSSIAVKTGQRIATVQHRSYVLEPIGQGSPRAPAHI